MKRLVPSSVWAAFAFSAVAIASAASCGNSESTNPISSSSSTGTGGGGGGTGGTGTGGTAGGGGQGVGGVQISGLSAPVKAVYDQYGVVHLACKTDDDCYAALGYMHAANRFFFMDFVRNSVRGSLGALVKAGDVVLQQDYKNRQFFTTKSGDPLEHALYQQASAPVRAIMDSYTKGVNAWIADMRAGKNGAKLTDEYDFNLIVKTAIRDWEVEDSAAVGLYVLNDLSNDAQSEIAGGDAVPLFPPALAADLFNPAPVFDAFTIPASMGAPPVPPPTPPISPAAIARLAPHQALLASAGAAMKLIAGQASGPKHRDQQGSNNWIAGPGRSANGHALLANDPHLLLGNPSIWFPVELDAKSNGGTGEYHVAGSTFPGLPSVMIGHNEALAWGVTTAYYDLDDVYLESLTSDNMSVNFNGSTVALTTKSYKFKDASTGMTKTQSFKWVPHHGPLVTEDDTAHTGVSIRWRGHDGGTDLDAFFGIARASTVAKAKVALQNGSSANQNFVVVDSQGHIAWLPYSKVPTRPWASTSLPPWLPLPGDGTAEWGAPVPYASLPQLEDPPLGAIATANNDMTGAWADGNPFNDGVPALQSAFKADGTREQRILDLLNAGGNTHSVDTFSAMQGDTYSLYASFVVPAVLTAAGTATLTPAQQSVVDALTAWQSTCPTGLAGDDPMSAKSTDPTETTESIGCTAFHTVFYAIVEQALGDEITTYCGADTTCQAALNSGISLQFVARAMKSPGSIATGALLWDDLTTGGTTEAETDILVRAIARASDILATIGASSDDWRWGKVHTLSLQSIYANFGLTMYNYGPYAAPGGLFTVNVANPDGKLPTPAAPPDFSFTSGPSVRFLVDAAPSGPTMKFQLPGGEDLHRDSKFYNNLLPNWLHNKPVDFAFGPGAVKNPAKTVDISPAP